MAVRCLLVDDNPGFLQAARALLEEEGLEVVGIASTGAEAIRSAADLRPDVTLVDIDLGEDSGLDLARRLAADPGIDPGRLILISAHAEEDFVDLIEASPAIGFLGKPALSAAAIERLLNEAGGRPGTAGEVRVATPGAALDGDLAVPPGARGVVLFAHGSGSSRRSPRNRQVAAGLRDAGYGTLLLDLLTEEEEVVDARTRELRFDVGLLAGRLTAAADWLDGTGAAGLPLATFGASTGAAAALRTAAERPDRVAAVISRGGRPDLAGTALARVRAPTLLVVGGADRQVLELNRAAAARLAAVYEIAVVPGAGHLFEEPGALEQVVTHAVRWLDRWLVRRAPGA